MTKNQTMLDEAFLLAQKAYTASDHANAKEQLQKQYPTHSWDEILDTYLKACNLSQQSYEIGDESRIKNTPDEKALNIMENRCPGFSKKTYNSALSQGWFLSR